ncbi:MAG: hypothetical protein Q7T50_04155 [Candidatus Magasanikbacteria bacterium]|nr:hypothetical protein [Candidatus Magasanikbacteria bacterium]
MNIPTKDKKVEQHNFPSYRDSREWLHRNHFKSKGMVLEEPWKEFFVECFVKEGFVALTMDVSYMPQSESLSLPLALYKNPYQIDIATTD